MKAGRRVSEPETDKVNRICITQNKQVLVTARSKRRGIAAARLLRLWIRFPPGEWTFVCVVSVVCGQVEVSAMS